MPLLRLTMCVTIVVVGATVLSFALMQHGTTLMANESKPPDVPKCEDVQSIGVATMDAGGVITMWLRSLPPGPIGEAQFVYKPGDRDYKSTIEHLGGIAPGETKPVKPWC